MNNDETWQEGEWERLVAVIHGRPLDYKGDFSAWLKKRPALWHMFVWYGFKMVQKNKFYGCSALMLLHDSNDEDGQLGDDDCRRAGDLGRLLVAIHPETLEVLWRGERYQEIDYLAEMVKCGEASEEELSAYEEELRWTDPDVLVFPELAEPPAVEPADNAWRSYH